MLFYCPFIILLLQKCGLPGVFIREDGRYACINGCRLCGKMSAVLRAAEEKEFAALIMTDCCNTSHGVYRHLKKHFPDKKIYYVNLPRIIDDAFYENMVRNSEFLEHRILRDFPQNAEKTFIEGIGGNENTSCWCSADAHLAALIQNMDFEQALKTLTERVICPRILPPAGKRAFWPASDDSVCKLRRYRRLITD